VLLGVTGSGKTFTMAQVIEATQRPALILAPNKILAAQLYGEMKSFFPDNAVEYFVSYYDYYQPEAYVARSDTYIEKESSVNEAIDRMRHSATRALLERDDVIIVASVSCLYGIGSVETYSAMIFDLEAARIRTRARSSASWSPCSTSATMWPLRAAISACAATIWKSSPATMRTSPGASASFGDEVESIVEFDPLTGKAGAKLEKIRVYANSHHVTPGPTMQQAMHAIRFELEERLKELNAEGKLLEAQRLEQRTNFDLEMIAATGMRGHRELQPLPLGRLPGEPPPTLFEYLPKTRCFRG
jgi:excinuclease ABC subunit B